MAKPRSGMSAVGDDGPSGFANLQDLLDSSRRVVVQTHDYPDLDAVASAWGLSLLLTRKGFASRPCYRGKIRSRSLNRLLSELKLDFAERLPASPDSQLIVVDGSPSNGNVSLVEGSLVGIIDHHCRDSNPTAPFIDIEPGLASCSTLIYRFWNEAGETIPMDLATALLTGIQSDTDFMSRRASAEDFAAYTELFKLGDFELASRIVRTVLDLRELTLVVRALESAVNHDGLLFAWLPGPCGQEVLAVLAEFVLRTEELRVVIIAEFGEDEAGEGDEGGGVHLSVRSKDPNLSAFSLIKRALEGIGACGGHSHSAGGFVPNSTFPGPNALRERFFSTLATS